MITPFRLLEEDIFPEVHSYVSNKLAKKGVKQNIIAEKLGITQAMVSKYMLKKPMEDKLVIKLGEKVIDAIRNNISNEEMCCEITQLSIDIMQSGELCEICSRKNNLKNCNACMNLGIVGDKNKVIENLKEAIRLLEEENPIKLVPNVMMNIAMRTDNAKGKEDVASIPGRIVKINNKVKASKSPEFSSSNHLANKLLENREFKAIVNIKYNKEIEKAIKKSGLNGVLIDKGSFGIEPCAYILGKDAVDVVNKVRKIKEELI